MNIIGSNTSMTMDVEQWRSIIGLLFRVCLLSRSVFLICCLSLAVSHLKSLTRSSQPLFSRILSLCILYTSARWNSRSRPNSLHQLKMKWKPESAYVNTVADVKNVFELAFCNFFSYVLSRLQFFVCTRCHSLDICCTQIDAIYQIWVIFCHFMPPKCFFFAFYIIRCSYSWVTDIRWMKRRVQSRSVAIYRDRSLTVHCKWW